VIRLTDSELAAVLAAAKPIAPHRRDAFLREIADALAGLSDVGPGDVGRAIRVAQRAHFDPPTLGDGE
jgi:hypothetical protein